MTVVTASLYFLAVACLLGSAVFVLAQGPRSRINQYYALLSASLLAWVATLFVYQSLPEGSELLWFGRANFAAVLVASTTSFLFVRELAGSKLRGDGLVWLESIAITGLTLLTPAIDRSEAAEAGGQHSTVYGPLFWLYLAHVVGYVGAAVVIALRGRSRQAPQSRLQLQFVGYGLLAMTVIAIVTNAYLPYVLGNFRYIDVGTLSTLAFVGAVGYATFWLHLFNVRFILKAAVIASLLVGFALELYQAAVGFLAHLVPLHDPLERTAAATTIALIVNSLTQQPLRNGLERVAAILMRRTANQNQKSTDRSR